MKNQLDEKDKTCQKLEMEVVDLRRKNEKSSAYVKFNNSSVILDEILDCQRSHFDKIGLGYKKKAKNYEYNSKTPKKIDAISSSPKCEIQDSPHIPAKYIRKFGGHQGVSPTPQSKVRKETSSWWN